MRVAIAQSSSGLGVCDATEGPRRVAADNGIFIIQRSHQRRDGTRISKVPQRHCGVAAQALPFGALDGAVAEALLIRRLVNVQQLGAAWKGDVFAWCNLVVDSVRD